MGTAAVMAPGQGQRRRLPVVTGNGPALTEQQRELLQLTLDGHTEWEVAEITGWRPTDVRQALRAAAQALGGGNKRSVALRALNRGLLAAPARPQATLSRAAAPQPASHMPLQNWPLTLLAAADLEALVLTPMEVDERMGPFPPAMPGGPSPVAAGWTTWRGQVDGQPVALRWSWIATEHDVLQDDQPIDSNLLLTDAPFPYDHGSLGHQLLSGTISLTNWQGRVQDHLDRELLRVRARSA